MTQKQDIQLFEDKKIRTVWDDETEKWYFSIVDIVGVLTDSSDYQTSRKYWNKLSQRLRIEGFEPVTNCHRLKMEAADGKMRLTDVADQEQMFRIIQSIPSPKAEPIKQWMARVASERVDEIQDPELAIDRAIDYYRKKGYGEGWIKARLKGKEARKALTDEWKRTGVKEQQYATLTDILTKEWSGFTTREYKDYKGLQKENLRDHMTNTENTLNTLAEVSTTDISRKKNPKNFQENKVVAKMGGRVAKVAKEELERQLGAPVVTRLNAKHLNQIEGEKEKK